MVNRLVLNSSHKNTSNFHDDVCEHAHRSLSQVTKNWMAFQEIDHDNDDGLLQLASRITPVEDDHFSMQQDGKVLNHKKFRNQQTADGDEAEEKAADLFSQQVPPNASDLANVDSVIASQMAKLSVTDREQVYMDVHGISDDLILETPEFVAQSLSDLQQEIDSLPDKRAYLIAERLSPQYVHGREFCLMFLRCEKFDCPKAALRITRHFQMKLDLFGEEKLVVDITQDDLDAEDMDVLHSCTGRFLKSRDNGGRNINLIAVVGQEHFKTDACLRKAFYNVMAAYRDEEFQRHGTVTVAFQAKEGKGSVGNPDLLWKLPKLNEGLPMRISALHWCWSHEVWRERQALLKNSYSNPIKVRIRVHHGTVQNCLEVLQGHGINPTCIPINDKGEMTDLVEERQRIEAQRRYERLNFPLRSSFYVPFSQDVLLGKGTPFQNFPGDQYKNYDKAQRAEKKVITMGIVDTIRQGGGLFLKQDGDKWIRVEDEVARLKVTAAFRTFRQRHYG